MSKQTAAERAREIGHTDYHPAMVKGDQQLANAAENIAIQLCQINQKLDLLIEVIENMKDKT